MMTRVLIGCLAFYPLGFASPADEPKGKDEPKETKLKPLIFSGTHSQINYETFNVIATEEGWEAQWDRHCGDRRRFHRGESQRLEIDFETHYVVAVFSGWCDWCEITARQRGDTVVIGYEATLWQTEGRREALTPDEKLQLARQQAWEDSLAPYAFVVLPKPVKTVIIEQGKRQDLTTPPVWKTRFLFPAPKSQK